MRIARVLLVSGTFAAALALVPSARAGDDAKPLDEHVLWALRWLKNHQSTDGRWDAKSYDEQCKLNRCDGPADAAHGPSATGLALLSFLGVGHTQRHGSNRDVVKNGLAYLRGIQDPQGCFGPAAAPGALYEHAVAELAICEANGMTGDPELGAPAQKGVAFLFSSPTAVGPWRADFPKDGVVDARALPWIVLALKSAGVTRLDVDVESMKRVVAWFDAHTDAKTGAVACLPKGPADDALTATSVVARAFADHTPQTDPAMGRALDAIGKFDAAADPAADHFRTLARLLMSRQDAERGASWRAPIRASFEKSQRMEPDRDERGSWDPVGPTIKSDGRLVVTAFSCLALVRVADR